LSAEFPKNIRFGRLLILPFERNERKTVSQEGGVKGPCSIPNMSTPLDLREAGSVLFLLLPFRQEVIHAGNKSVVVRLFNHQFEVKRSILPLAHLFLLDFLRLFFIAIPFSVNR
jgi:hypothetical protein